jgi:hypothetical protein
MQVQRISDNDDWGQFIIIDIPMEKQHQKKRVFYPQFDPLIEDDSFMDEKEEHDANISLGLAIVSIHTVQVNIDWVYTQIKQRLLNNLYQCYYAQSIEYLRGDELV